MTGAVIGPIAPGEWRDVAADDRAIMLAAQEAIQINRKSLERVLIIGRGFERLQALAMEQSHSDNPVGLGYTRAYARLEKPVPGLSERSIDKGTRSCYVQCWQHREDITAWWETVPQGQRDRWNTPRTVLRQWQKSTGAPVGKRRSPEAKPRSMTGELSMAVDRITEAAEGLEVKRAEAGMFDLSTAAMRRASAETMAAFYGSLTDPFLGDLKRVLLYEDWEDTPENIAAALLRLYPKKAPEVFRIGVELVAAREA